MGILPDYMQITMKMRQDVKFHNKAPINGRVMDPEDWVASWERFKEVGPARMLYANDLNPLAPIVSMEVVDPTTIVLNLARPDVSLFGLLGWPDPGRYIVMPKEAGDTWDPQADMIGTGPFVLENHDTGISFTLRGNQDYWEDRPYVDTVEAPFLDEYAAALAQFQAGSLYTYEVFAEDVLATKQQVPDLNMYVRNTMTPFNFGWIGFGWQGEDIPGTDERVRQAFSMAIDRDLWLDTFYNIPQFEAEGLPMIRGWSSALGAGAGIWYLDPRSDEFGENGRYYQYNPEEAMKLLAAAGYPDGLDINAHRMINLQLGDYEQNTEVTNGFLNAIGVNTNTVRHDYFTEFRDLRNSQGAHDGFLYLAGPAPNDPISFFLQRYYSKGGAGSIGYEADPDVDSMIESAQGEFDVEARRTIVNDLQRHLAEKQYMISTIGAANEFVLAWPVLQNFFVEQDDNARSGNWPNQGVFNWWIDETKAPLA